MRVILIANYLPDRQPSMQRFAALMEAGLLAAGIEVTTVRPEVRLGRWAGRFSLLKKWLGYIDKFVIFPARLRRWESYTLDRSDRVVFHVCDHSNAMYVASLNRVPHVVTCHDLFAVRCALGEVLDQPTRWSGRALQKMILRGLKQARAIACDSKATSVDVSRIIQPEAALLRTIWLCLSPDQWSSLPPLQKEDWTRLLGIANDNNASQLRLQRFILHVGGDSWYKNRLGVLRIFSELNENVSSDLGLVMVGTPLTGQLQSFVAERSSLRGRVHCVQNLQDADLAVLYRAAEALLFPSLDEGFGWPVLEAHACGCRVVCSRKGSLPEVGGTAAYYIDPANEAGAAMILENVLLQSAVERKAASAAAVENAARFSLKETTRQYIEIYQQALQTQT